MAVRVATSGDVPALMAVRDNRDLWRRCLRDNDGTAGEFLVATLGEELAGFAQIRFRAEASRLVPKLSDLHVRAPLRQRGVASAIIDACEQRARARGFDTLYMSISVDNQVMVGIASRRGYVALQQRPYEKSARFHLPDGSSETRTYRRIDYAKPLR